jgi:hypothetical protein
MKNILIDLNEPNEPIMFNHSILGNCYYYSFCRNHKIDISSHVESNIQSEILHCTIIYNIDNYYCVILQPHYNIVYKIDSNHNVQSNIVSRYILEMYANFTKPERSENKTNYESMLKLKRDPNMWTLSFDGSNPFEGAGCSFILKDPTGKKTLIACRLEFQCTNNTVKYEALLQGLRKEIDLGEKKIKVFGDSKFVIRHVRNTIH